MILITGANWQLGHDFQRILKERNRDFIATDYKEIDITDIDAERVYRKIKIKM